MAGLYDEQDPRSTDDRGRLVRNISLTASSGTQSLITSVDWATFSRTAASFSQLNRIAVCVKEGSEEKAAYMKHAHEHLESLSREREVTLEILDPSQ